MIGVLMLTDLLMAGVEGVSPAGRLLAPMLSGFTPQAASGLYHTSWWVHLGTLMFFLTFLPTPNLNGKHTVFGRVIEGLDVLAEIQRIDPDNPDPEIKPDQIIEAKVIRKRDHEYKPNKVE